MTPCGSLAALAYLLPPGATAVVMNYLQSETGANVQLDDDAFWNMDHVTLTYYPVGPEDYEGTMVRCRWLQPVQSLHISKSTAAMQDLACACILVPLCM